MSDRLTFNHGASALSPRLIGRHERGGRAGRSRHRRDRPDAWSGPGPLAREGVSRDMARAERPDLSYWGVFAFTALLFFRPQDTLPMLEPLHLPEIAAVVGLIAMVLRRAGRGLPPVPAVRDFAPLAAFGGVMLLTAPFSIWPSGALGTFTDLFLKVVLVFVLLTHALSSPRLLRRFTWLIVVAMGYIAFRGWIDYASGNNLLQGERLQGAVPGLMGNPNDLAMNMVTFLPFAAFAALGRGKALARLFAAGVTLLMLGTILFAKSRGGFLALAVTGVLIVAQSGRLRPGLAALLVVGTLVATPLMPQSFWTRLSSIVNSEDDETGSREARVVLLQDGVKAFSDHPFTGVGAGQFQNYNPPDRQELWRETHNVELQVLTELGLIGGMAFVWMLVQGGRTAFTVWQALRPRRRLNGAAEADPAFAPHEREWMRAHVGACIAAFAGWLVCAQFGSIGYYWTLYYVLALIVAARETLARRLDWASVGVARGGAAA
ncbi:MAG: O-antigen ligase family protein [Vicinamibacteraceae bacterium]